MVKLRASGYNRNQRWEILKSGSRKFSRMLEDEDMGIRRVNRPRWEGGHGRYLDKILKKKNWYRKKKTERDSNEKNGESYGRKVWKEKTEKEKSKPKPREKEMEEDSEEIESVMFLPSTPHGELMKRVKEADRQFRRGTDIKRIKFVERAGKSLQDILVSGNPWSDLKCGREKCFVCRSEKGGMGECMRENALYRILCKE